LPGKLVKSAYTIFSRINIIPAIPDQQACEVGIPSGLAEGGPSTVMSEKPSTTLNATVEKIITPISPKEPEKAQIAVEGADHLYRELRIENTLTTESGEKVRMKPGAEVEVKIEVDPAATAPTEDGNS
jgi:hypothetical protein